MASHTSKTTTDHAEIRRWAEARNATPACVKGTGSASDPGMIRLDFPGYSGESLEPISWHQWFAAFDKNKLALVYQDETADGARSNFNKLIGRDTAEKRAHGDDHASRHHDAHGSHGSSARGSSHRSPTSSNHPAHNAQSDTAHHATQGGSQSDSHGDSRRGSKPKSSSRSASHGSSHGSSRGGSHGSSHRGSSRGH